MARRGARHVPFVTQTISRGCRTDRQCPGSRAPHGPTSPASGACFAAGNWLLDAAALWVLLAAFGSTTHRGVVLTVYGVGNPRALLPITPGGPGIVESVMVSSLIAFGTPAPIALLGVIGWRLMKFWLPLPLAPPPTCPFVCRTSGDTASRWQLV